MLPYASINKSLFHSHSLPGCLAYERGKKKEKKEKKEKKFIKPGKIVMPVLVSPSLSGGGRYL
jgi:hypothetical protein